MTTDSNEREGVGHDAHFYLDLIEKYQGGRNGPTIQLRAAIEQIEAELARWTPAAAPQAQPSEPMFNGLTEAETAATASVAGLTQAQPAKAEQGEPLDLSACECGDSFSATWRGMCPGCVAARSPEPAPISDERIEEFLLRLSLVHLTMPEKISSVRALLAEKGQGSR